MKNAIVILLGLFGACLSQAAVGGAVFVNFDNSHAQLVVNEREEEGQLAKLFTQIKIAETVRAGKRVKSFQLSNGRFSFVCSQIGAASAPSATSCTFDIKTGEDTSDVSTYITTFAGSKLATIGMTQVFAKELLGVFPTDENGAVNFLLKLPNGIVLESQGSVVGGLTVRFSSP